MSENRNGKEAAKYIKCVVWDLDNTLWNGVLLESDAVAVHDHVVEIIKTLDGRGLLQSIASKNDYATAKAKLVELGLDEYFLYPQITWNSKVASIKAIAESINIGRDSIAFIDDDPYERQEVQFSLPEVLCIDPVNLNLLLDMPEMMPRFITEDSRQRRQMYLSDIARKKIEEEFTGPKEEFLASLDMAFTISTAQEGDLQRAEELTVRTNQLNTTGYTYSYEELNEFRKSEHHKLMIASLEDKFGSYGKIGLALVETKGREWTIKLMLMSCRVMSRGIGTIMLNHIMGMAQKAGATLLAEFVPNGRNRMMYISYKFAGFVEKEKRGELVIFENRLARIQPFPDYIRVSILE